jgi:predicted kinase
MATLIAFSGLPTSGKSSIARALAQRTGAIWLRIDSIEQAIKDSGVVPGSLDDAGYRAAYAVAEDNLRLGRDVIGDSVNPWMLTRDACRATGTRAGARVVEVETVQAKWVSRAAVNCSRTDRGGTCIHRHWRKRFGGGLQPARHWRRSAPTLRYRSPLAQWVRDDRDGLSRAYARARCQQIEPSADELLAIADDGTLDPNDRRVRLDTRKWLMARLNPARYGDRIQVADDHQAPIAHVGVVDPHLQQLTALELDALERFTEARLAAQGAQERGD